MRSSGIRVRVRAVGRGELGSDLLAGISILIAVLIGVAALLTTAALGWVAISRFRSNSHALHAQRPIGDARPQLLISAVVSLTALGALLFALTA